MKDASSGAALAAPDICRAPYAGSARAARQVRCGSRRLGRQPTSTMPPPPWKRDGADLGCKCLKVMTSGRVPGWHALGSARAVCDIELARPQSREAFAGFSLGPSLRVGLQLAARQFKRTREAKCKETRWSVRGFSSSVYSCTQCFGLRPADAAPRGESSPLKPC